MSKWLSDIGKGWRPIVERAIEELESKGAKILQVKEKFGGLRIYYGISEPNDMRSIEFFEELRAIVRKAEDEAEVTCEACGKPGKKTSIKGWLKTVCPDHEKGFDRSVYEE